MAHAHCRRLGILGLLVAAAAAGGMAQETPVFTAPVALNPNAAFDTGEDSQVHAAGDGNGNWVAVWASSDTFGGLFGNDQDIFVAYSNNHGGTWVQSGALNSNASFDSGFDGAPRIATDGRGRWIAVWYSRDTLNGAVGDDYDIFITRSDNNGQTWSLVQVLNNDASGDVRQDLLPQIATDGEDTWVVVWEAFGEDRDLYFVRSGDNGDSWSAPAPLNTNAATDSGDDYQSSLVHDSVGGFVCVWGSDENLGGVSGTDGDLLFARATDGLAWSAPELLNLNASSDNSRDQNPNLATDGAGNLVCVWNSPQNLQSSGGDEDILVARSSNGGASWTAPVLLDAPLATIDSAVDTTPTVATNGEGRWMAVWSSGNSLNSSIGTDRDVLVKASDDNGATWSATAVLNLNASLDSGADNVPAIFHAGGAWLAAWESDDTLAGALGDDNDILFAQWLEPVLPWGAPAPVNSFATTDLALETDRAPALATDGKGVWVAVWESSAGLGGTLGNDYDILWSRSSDGGGTWSDAAALNPAATSDFGDDLRPVIATDGVGNWAVAWETENEVFGSGADSDLLISRSGNNGLSWSSPVLLNSNALQDTADDASISLAVSRANGVWTAAWTATESGSGAENVYYTRSLDAAGNWTPPVLLHAEVDPSSGTDRDVQLATDGLNAWVAVWASKADVGGSGTDDYDILAARSVNAGLNWSAPVLLNSHGASDAADADDLEPTLATDSRGSWICVWSSTHNADGRMGVDTDLFLARSTSNGSNWTLATSLNRYAPFDGAGADGAPSLAYGGGNVWGLAWLSGANLANALGNDLDVFFATSRNQGESWSQPETLNTFVDAPAVDEFGPTLTQDGRGSWIAAWSGFSGTAALGVDGDIVARRVRAPNLLSITADAPIITSAAEIGYTLRFSEAVFGLSIEKLSLGITGNVTGVLLLSLEETGVGEYLLRVDTGEGSGSLSVGLFDNDNIVNAEGTPLGGIGQGNGDFFGNALVLDKNPPELTIAGSNPQTLACFEPYVEQGAIAIDAVYSNVSSAIVIDGTVNTGQAGSYLVTYTAADPLGNSTSATRTVNVEGDCGGEGEGGTEGEGEGGGEGEGQPDGEIEGAGDGETDGEVPGTPHAGDTSGDGRISLSELLRVIQFFNSNALHCQGGTEDGYAPGTGAQDCASHTSDYNPQDWRIVLTELLRLIQFYNADGYEGCPGGEDGYCPVFN